MSKATPGPWFVWNEIVLAGPFKRIKGRISGYRAEICRMGDLDTTEIEREANARLIAAAPDLLDALKDAESELACHPRINSYVIDKVRAAIAKATAD